MASESGRGPCEDVAEASHTSAGGAHLVWRMGCGHEPVERLKRHRCGSAALEATNDPRVKRPWPCMDACVQESLFVTRIFSWFTPGRRLLPPMARVLSNRMDYRPSRLARPALQRRGEAGQSCEIVHPPTQRTLQSSMLPSYQCWIHRAGALIVMLSLGACGGLPTDGERAPPRP